MIPVVALTFAPCRIRVQPPNMMELITLAQNDWNAPIRARKANHTKKKVRKEKKKRKKGKKGKGKGKKEKKKKKKKRAVKTNRGTRGTTGTAGLASCMVLTLVVLPSRIIWWVRESNRGSCQHAATAHTIIGIYLGKVLTNSTGTAQPERATGWQTEFIWTLGMEWNRREWKRMEENHQCHSPTSTSTIKYLYNKVPLQYQYLLFKIPRRLTTRNAKLSHNVVNTS